MKEGREIKQINGEIKNLKISLQQKNKNKKQK